MFKVSTTATRKLRVNTVCDILKENSAVSLEEWVLVFKVSTTATRWLRVNTVCDIFEREFSCFFRGVGLGV